VTSGACAYLQGKTSIAHTKHWLTTKKQLSVLEKFIAALGAQENLLSVSDQRCAVVDVDDLPQASARMITYLNIEISHSLDLK
jgi:hypothetical protein